MSQMSTVAVFRCKYCGRPVYVKQCRTFKPDPNGELLNKLMSGLPKVARACPRCRKRLEYYRSQGRERDFWAGHTVPIDLDGLIKHLGTLVGGKQ